MMIHLLCTVFVIVLSGFALAGESVCPNHSEHYKQVDDRGDHVMGFEKTKTIHHFQLTKNGGVIRVEARDDKDEDSIGKIRKHLLEVTAQFSRGEFSLPEAIHGRVPPGVPEMTEHKDSILYTNYDTSNGGQIRIKTENPEVLKAIHAFLRFQIEDHRTGDATDIQ